MSSVSNSLHSQQHAIGPCQVNVIARKYLGGHHGGGVQLLQLFRIQTRLTRSRSVCES